MAIYLDSIRTVRFLLHIFHLETIEKCLFHLERSSLQVIVEEWQTLHGQSHRRSSEVASHTDRHSG